MSAKIAEQHRQRPAYIYVRQSTIAQVRFHQESTERQYALREKALELGCAEAAIRTLDRDLGVSGAQMAGREDFKTLVADVSMGKAGAVFALEASRLARSSLDWHRLTELCALTGTLVIDEDGCYDPSDFNDRLLLGLKGTLAQAELHFLRARLQGGKLNKARKGELRFPLPVGLCYGEEGRIILDPDVEVQGAVRLVFSLFQETGSPYGVMQRFARLGLRFPKRAYGGVWAGQLVWGPLTHGRILGVLKNPSYAGVYVFGRYQSQRTITPAGEVHAQIHPVEIDAWRVCLKDHHEAYATWEEFLRDQEVLAENQTNAEATVLSGPAREGLALLQGLLLCGSCGRRLTVRYRGNGGLYPVYECNWLRREGRATKACMAIRCDLLDGAVAGQALTVLKPADIELALEALRDLEARDQAVMRQWQMRLERARYEAQLAEKRYQEVDPANRLVAATLERRWNETLERLEDLNRQFAETGRPETRAVTPEQKARVLAWAQDFPRLWNPELVGRVRELACGLGDGQIAERLNQEGRRSATGQAFNASMIQWVRFRHRIPKADLRRPEELAVKQVAEHFGVSSHVVYYWIEHGILATRRLGPQTPCWVTLDPAQEQALWNWVRASSRIQASQHPQTPL